MESNNVDEIRRKVDEIRRKVEAEIERIKEPLFAPKCNPAPSAYLNACVDWPVPDWDTYAEGYKRAGDILVQWVAENDRDQDFLIYPIAFLYRHYVEVRLKDLIVLGSRLSGTKPEIAATHRLVRLWREARPYIECAFPSGEPWQLDAVGARLEELSTLDRDSITFRYPISRKGSRTLGGVRHIHLGQLRDVIQGLSDVLDGASIGMGEHLNWKHEMEQDNLGSE